MLQSEHHLVDSERIDRPLPFAQALARGQLFEGRPSGDAEVLVGGVGRLLAARPALLVLFQVDLRQQGSIG